MKTPQTILTAFLIFLTFHLSAQDPVWQTVHPFSDYHNYETGYVGADGLIFLAGAGGRVTRSTDNGETWTDLPNFTDIDLRFFDAFPGTDDLVLLAGHNEAFFRSADGGDSWEEVTQDLGLSSVTTLEIISNDRAVIGSFLETLYYTTDGGLTWSEGTITTTTEIRDFSFINADDGFGVSTSGAVFTTTDGGMTWDSLTQLTVNQTRRIAFADANTGYVAATQGVFWATSDGGQTWTETAAYEYPTNADEMLLANGTIYVLPSGGTKVFWSTDGGENWSDAVIADYVYNDFSKIMEAPDGTLWVVGEYQSLAYSTNDGEDWTDIFGGEKGNLSFVEFTADGVGFAGGSAYELLQQTTSDGEWQVAGQGEGPIMTGFAALPSGELFYTRGYSGIFKSVDGGDNWDSNFNTDGFARCIGRTPGGNLFVSTAINENTIYRTTDGGFNWTGYATPNELDLRGFAFATDDLGYGWKGIDLIVTEDGGDSWSVSDLDFSGSVANMFFLDDQTGWLLTSTNMYQTTDGGENWMEVNKPPYGDALVFMDANTGWAAGGSNAVGGYVYRTDDGGTTWNEVYTTQYRLKDIALAAAETALVVAVGDAGIIVDNNGTIPTAVTDPSVQRPTSLTAFPNPGTGQVVLDHSFSDGRLQVFAPTGQLLQQMDLGRIEQPEINLSALPPGWYILRVQDADRQYVGRWIKR